MNVCCLSRVAFCSLLAAWLLGCTCVSETAQAFPHLLSISCHTAPALEGCSMCSFLWLLLPGHVSQSEGAAVNWREQLVQPRLPKLSGAATLKVVWGTFTLSSYLCPSFGSRDYNSFKKCRLKSASLDTKTHLRGSLRENFECGYFISFWWCLHASGAIKTATVF